MRTARLRLKRGRSASVSTSTSTSTSSRSPSPSTSPGSPGGRRSPACRVAAFLFRRDFRLADNTAFHALYEAAGAARLQVLPLFFFNPAQCDKTKNPYFGDASFQFLCQSLEDLDQQLHRRLVCLRGSDTRCLRAIQRQGVQIDLLGYNLDFTPFARWRDRTLQAWCEEHAIQTVTAHDYTLLPLDAVRNASGEPYSVFTAFYRRVLADFADTIPAPQPAPPDAALQRRLWHDGPRRLAACRLVDPAAAYTPLPAVSDAGGRASGLGRLRCVAAFRQYGAERDDMAADRTTHWSPHLKFGTISVRECWHAASQALGAGHDLTRQLVWREFYSTLLFHRPELVMGQLPPGPDGRRAVNEPFQAKYKKFQWKWKDEHFEAFKAGRTGVPLVDAGVACLKTTGWCPNRCRMVLANYLVKTLGVDWREGERWYATLAVDYDVANNSGGWLWSSGQGADAQPYFRTFNPFRQSARFDPSGAFIRRWVPQLAEAPAAVIHSWEEQCVAPKSGQAAAVEAVLRSGYPRPIVSTKDGNRTVLEAFTAYNARLGK